MFESPKFTARNIAKYGVKFTIASVTSKLTAGAISDYTRFDEDDKIVEFTAFVVGWGVSEKLKPVTDVAVDKTFDFVITQRVKHQDRRNKKNAEEKK